jgi:beta-lactamase regulating signal transducer with metallopeptidase domain
MNNVLEQINSVGKVFVDFAWPMLLQSSVLIAILLLVDFLLRRRVRAVFRYWLWMLVVIKLVLPTSLSSPVSIGRFMGQPMAAINITENKQPVAGDISNVPNQSLNTEGMAESRLDLPPAATIHNPPVEPAASLAWQGGVFMVWLAIMAAMLLLLLQRAMFVCGLVRQSAEVNGLMNDTLKFCCNLMGVRQTIGLKVSPNATSPAVCGLFRPVILLPQGLGSSVGISSTRVVLMHELAHIKHGDLWVNLLQTLLQIAYFYNPLLWLANWVIRRVREQAVDEAVQVALGEKAQQYPETLLNVARLAFERPALSLRLVGVVESKSALAGRIKRMLTRPIPKTAKLGIIGSLTIILFAAVLLPMAKAEKTEGQTTDDSKSTDALFTAKLDNGVTVELVAVCDYPDGETRSWRPDGSKIEKQIYVKREKGYQDGKYGFIMRVDIPADSSFSWNKIEGSQGWYGSCTILDSKGVEIDGYQAAITKEHDGRETTNIKVGIATGPWNTVAEHDGRSMATKGDSGFIFSKAYETGTAVNIVVSGKWQKDREQRIVAIDANGNLHADSSGSVASGGIQQMTGRFDNMKPSQIKEFRIQTRPYQWIEFRNVSLRPGMKTDVAVVVEESQAKAEDGQPVISAAEFGDTNGANAGKENRMNKPEKTGPPVVVKTTPVTYANDVSPDLNNLTVTFNQRMADKSWAWVRWDAPYPETVGQPYYDNKKRTCTLPVKLEPGKAYLVAFNIEPYIGFVNAAGEPARPYVLVFATKDKDGKPTPIPEELIAKAKSVNDIVPEPGKAAGEAEPIPYTQVTYDEIRPDGTILFKNTVREINKSGKEVTSKKFINSDFVQVTAMRDSDGRDLKLTSIHDGDIYRYEVVFNKPIPPGGLVEYTSEGTMDGLIKPVPGSKDTFQYYMKHHPAAGQPTQRVETYLLPAGAELISTTPEDMERRTKDGRIELHVEKMIPPGGSITTSFRYRMPEG